MFSSVLSLRIISHLFFLPSFSPGGKVKTCPFSKYSNPRIIVKGGTKSVSWSRTMYHSLLGDSNNPLTGDGTLPFAKSFPCIIPFHIHNRPVRAGVITSLYREKTMRPMKTDWPRGSQTLFFLFQYCVPGKVGTPSEVGLGTMKATDGWGLGGCLRISVRYSNSRAFQLIPLPYKLHTEVWKKELQEQTEGNARLCCWLRR